ncbi:MAG: plasmid pRiA4b ORF-3 family protein [Pseudonocardiales bacterium]
MGEGKRVTPKDVLRPVDVPAAAQLLAIPVPPRIRTAAAVPALHRPWKVALAVGFLRIIDGKAVTGPALDQWPDTDDDTVPGLWLTALIAAFAASAGNEDKAVATVSDVLVGFGAATRHGQRLDATPLGRWASQEMHARMPEPISADLPAAELIARLADPGENDAWRAAQPWLADRDPLPAAREILAAAAVATPAQRIAAVEVVFALGDPAEAAWLAVDYAMAALTKSGPDEALSCIDEQIAVEDLDSRIRAITGVGHPDTATLVAALSTFVASGVKPASSQVYQLKIALKRMRNPVWRRVLMPAAASLGQLHEVIQIVMNWDGDHLHAFSVGDKRYSDPFYMPELDDEEQHRLSGAFTPTTKTISYLYDFGASWYHDITCEKVLELDVDATYPVCVAGSGDFPIEYWSEEDDDQEAVPFDKDKINNRLGQSADNSDPECCIAVFGVCSDRRSTMPSIFLRCSVCPHRRPNPARSGR